MFLSIFKKIWFLWFLGFAVNIITLLSVYIKVGTQFSKTVVLHYNVIVGVDRYGEAWHLLEIPIAGFLIFILNFIFYKATKNSQAFFTPLIAGINLAIQIILLIAALLIIRAN